MPSGWPAVGIAKPDLWSVAGVIRSLTGGIPRLVRASLGFLRWKFNNQHVSGDECNALLKNELENTLLVPPPELGDFSVSQDLHRISSASGAARSILGFLLRCCLLRAPFHESATVDLGKLGLVVRSSRS